MSVNESSITYSSIVLSQYFCEWWVTCETTDGKTVTCLETIESVDEQKKTIVFKLFGEAVDGKYKPLKLIFEAIEKDGGRTAIRWSIEYEKLREDVHPPYAYLELYDHVIKDVDAHIVEAEKNATK